MQNLEQTIISQYGNSPTITQLIQNMNQYLDPTTNFDDFLSFVWDVSTAQGFGLDIWGRIVNVSRQVLSNPVYSLSDESFRSLILIKALSNISRASAPATNQLLTNWMSGRGRCYVGDNGGMVITYTFEFALEPFEIAIIQNSGIFLRPAGVGARIVQSVFPVFGFKEMGTAWVTPFNGAPFIAEA